MRQHVHEWPRVQPAKSPAEETKGGKKPPKPSEATPVEGYWQEWTPEGPLPNNGYCTQLYLPAGAYIVNAAAAVRLSPDAIGSAEVECSLFVGSENRSLNQLDLSPGEGQSIAATAHVECSETTEVQWNCGSTTAPFRLQLAVTAVKVHRLVQVGTQPVP